MPLLHFFFQRLFFFFFPDSGKHWTRLHGFKSISCRNLDLAFIVAVPGRFINKVIQVNKTCSGGLELWCEWLLIWLSHWSVQKVSPKDFNSIHTHAHGSGKWSVHQMGLNPTTCDLMMSSQSVAASGFHQCGVQARQKTSAGLPKCHQTPQHFGAACYLRDASLFSRSPPTVCIADEASSCLTDWESLTRLGADVLITRRQ